jgi:hypothetical protein
MGAMAEVSGTFSHEMSLPLRDGVRRPRAAILLRKPQKKRPALLQALEYVVGRVGIEPTTTRLRDIKMDHFMIPN